MTHSASEAAAGSDQPDLVCIASGELTVCVAGLGAETRSIRDAAGRDYLWHGDPAHWTGRAPILFPIVGAAPGDQIAVGDHQAGMKQHGFARLSRFDLDGQGPDWCRHVLRDTAETRAPYPFGFELAVRHALAGPVLTVSARIRNDSDRDMPFGFGFHPAFAWPLPGAAGRPHRVALDNGACPPRLRLAGAGANPGLLARDLHPSPFRDGALALSPALFDAGALVFPEGAGAGLRYGVPGGPDLRFRFEGLPNLALWTRPGAPFLCVEPWHGMAAWADAGPQLADRPFTRWLAPKAQADFSFSVEFS